MIHKTSLPADIDWNAVHRETFHAFRRYAKNIPAGSKEGKVYGKLSVARIPSEDWPIYPALTYGLAGLIADHAKRSILFQMVLSNLGSNSGINSHTDPHKIDDDIPLRYHVPIVTNPESFWWDDINEKVHMERGYFYGPMPYESVRHAVWNEGWNNRIHLIVDVRGEQ